ncbi:MAG: RipA family octameric membrane protein [Nitrospiria bacterium]
MSDDYPFEEYRIVVASIRHEDRSYWTRFSALFAINSALLAAIGVLLTNKALTALQTSYFAIVLGIVGFLVSLVWFFAAMRAEKIHGALVKRAKCLEKKARCIGKKLEMEKKETKAFPQTYTNLHHSLSKSIFVSQVPILSAAAIIPIAFAVSFAILPSMFSLNFNILAQINYPSAVVDFALLMAFLIWGYRKMKQYRDREEDDECSKANCEQSVNKETKPSTESIH